MAESVEEEIAKHHLNADQAKAWIDARNFVIQYFQIPPTAEIELFSFYSYRPDENLAYISWTTSDTNGHLIGHARTYNFNTKTVVSASDTDLTAFGVH